MQSIGRRRAAGTLNFQANGAENLLVPLPARPSASVPTMHFLMMRLIRNGMWEVLVIYLFTFTPLIKVKQAFFVEL